MTREYSTHEAKAKFSEVIGLVRSGMKVVITYHGKRVAEIKPIERDELSIAERIAELEARGIIVRAKNSKAQLKTIAKRPGALKRFLDERE